MDSKAASRCGVGGWEVGRNGANTAHLQSRRRSLQPTSNVHHRRQPGNRAAANRLLRPPPKKKYPFSGGYLSCEERQVCLVSLCFFPTVTHHHTFDCCSFDTKKEKYTSPLSFKIRVSILPDLPGYHLHLKAEFIQLPARVWLSKV